MPTKAQAAADAEAAHYEALSANQATKALADHSDTEELQQEVQDIQDALDSLRFVETDQQAALEEQHAQAKVDLTNAKAADEALDLAYTALTNAQNAIEDINASELDTATEHAANLLAIA